MKEPRIIEFTINDRPIKAKEGTSILRAALDNGIYIPHFCYDKRLKAYGGCRLCIVEIKGARKMSTSCSTPAKNGMEVYTETPKVISARKTLLELLLVHHPLDCGICDKAGECDLQDLAFKYGAAEGRFQAKRKKEPERLDAPVVERNTNRCILCGKCVKICTEHQGVGAINFIGRGFKTITSPAFEETLNCEFCGQCIDICPVGALNSKYYRHASRTWYMDEHDMPCPYCGCGCITTLSVQEGKIIRAKGVEGKGQNQGNLCSRGRFGFDYVNSSERLTKPLIRKARSSSEFKEVSWDEAFGYIAERLSAIGSQYGADKTGAIGSQRCTIEDNYMLQKFMRQVVGTDSIDSAAIFGYEKAQKAFEWAFGSGFNPISWDAPLNADFLLVVESDITSLMPVWGLNFLEAKRNGAQLVVADHKKTKFSRNSSRWLRINPGSGTALINGMIGVILNEGLYDKAAEKLPLFDALRSCIAEFTPQAVEKMTGVAADEVSRLAREYAASGKRLISLTAGSAENTKNLNVILAAANLAVLMGDGPETLQVPAEHANTLGMIAAGVRPRANGKNAYDMLYKAGTVKALYITGEDPLVMLPDTSKIAQSFSELDLLIVQDIFMTETAKMADVVLPAAAWSEKDGHFMSATGNIQKSDKICIAPGEAKPDWEIFIELAKKMGKDMGINNFDAVRNAALAEADQFAKEGAAALAKNYRAFNPVTYKLLEEPDAQYPFRLITSNILQHSGAFSVLSRNLDDISAEPYLQINTADAERLGIENGSFVEVSSRRGSILAKSVVSDEVPQGSLFAPVHFSWARINALTYPSVNGGVPVAAASVQKVQAG
ncbi:MAG: molybdopterin-dependent oxidoreductase [Nitrospiraceae bacterium]|nr:molybdopterin-dependent oxidoreductase [Nitrospiraceae bacterium]